MLRSSKKFDDAIIYGHDVATRCEIVDSKGQVVFDTPNIVSGSVSVDSGRKIRRQCSLTFQDPTGTLVPNTAKDILQPYSGYFMRLYRGASYRDGTPTELFPLGTFAPYAPKIVDKGSSLEISITGYDRSKIISRTRWTRPYVIPSGTNTATAIKNLLDTRMSGLRYNLEQTRASVPLTTLGTEADNDPWDDAIKLANADGMELFMDPNDIVTLRTIPDPAFSPIVKTYADDDKCTVMEFQRENDASGMYTGVIVRSEGSEVRRPLHIEVWRRDTDLKIPYFFSTSVVTTVEQAIATGESLLRRVGYAEFGAQLTVVPDPRHEAGDVIRVKRDLSRLDDAFTIANFDIPLDATSEMAITTEMRRMT